MLRWFAVLVLGLFSVGLQADGFIWKVSKGESRIFLGGSIHMLTARDYPLPVSYDLAFEGAKTLVLEMNLAEATQPENQASMMKMMLYPPGQSLAQSLSPATLKALESFCHRRGIPLQSLLQMRPAMLAMNLSVVEMQRLNYQQELGVDAYYYSKATQSGKSLVGLESFIEQMAFVADMGGDDEDALVRYTLRDLDGLAEMLVELKQAWRQGDTARVEQMLLKPMRQEAPQAYHSLVVQRNRNWLPKLESLLRSPGDEMVLVGALHLVGPDGLLTALAQRGYQVEAL